MVGPTPVYALILLSAGSLAVSLVASLLAAPAALCHVHRSHRERFSKVLAALHLAWLFALLSAASLAILTYALADTNVLDLLSPSPVGKVIVSRPFILFVFGSLYLLPVVTLVLEDKTHLQTRPSSEQVHFHGRHHGTF